MFLKGPGKRRMRLKTVFYRCVENRNIRIFKLIAGQCQSTFSYIIRNADPRDKIENTLKQCGRTHGYSGYFMIIDFTAIRNYFFQIQDYVIKCFAAVHNYLRHSIYYQIYRPLSFHFAYRLCHLMTIPSRFASSAA